MKEPMAVTDEDHDILVKIEKKRQQVRKPLQSGFCVVSAIAFKRKTGTGDSESGIIFGMNDEPCHISGSICAERCAFLQLRLIDHEHPLVTTVYVTTDSKLAIPPGMLCREFMVSSRYTNENTVVVMASAGYPASVSPVKKLSLYSLYPSPSVFTHLPTEECLQLQEASKLTRPWPQDKDDLRVVKAACDAAEESTNSHVHPIKYGAAVLFQDDTLASGWQKSAVEYGCTFCAISQLAQVIIESKAPPVLLAQADSCGILHAPFAAARAFLSEHGYGDCKVFCHQRNEETGKLHLTKTTVKELSQEQLAIFDRPDESS